MIILQVHSFYEVRGGEDVVVESEKQLLEKNGHTVLSFYKYNSSLLNKNKFLVAINSIWNIKIFHELNSFLKKNKPDVVHCHNTFPLISPAIYWACARESIPVVQTLHNYRLLCPSAILFFKGEIYESSIGKLFPWQAVKDRVYRNSRLGTLVVAFMLFFHRIIGTWKNKVTLYIALTQFQKEKMIEGGIKSSKIVLKGNFLNDEFLSNIKNNQLREIKKQYGSYCIFVGRISFEKGYKELVMAWNEFLKINKNTNKKLIIIGDGPNFNDLEDLLKKFKIKNSVILLGKKEKLEVLSFISCSEFLILPSICYEAFALTIIEAFACSKPVVVSKKANTADIVVDRKNGLIFKTGDIFDMSKSFRWAFENNDKINEMGKSARKSYIENYSNDIALKNLISTYNKVLKEDV